MFSQTFISPSFLASYTDAGMTGTPEETKGGDETMEVERKKYKPKPLSKEEKKDSPQ
jgi:hypothetical protein